jgi:hypothetical protein
MSNLALSNFALRPPELRQEVTVPEIMAATLLNSTKVPGR